MITALSRAVLASVLVVSACSSSSSGSGTPREGGVGGAASNGLPTCDATCPGVLAAHCSRGPVDQADCVNGCQAVRGSPCAAQYQALYDCGGPTPVYGCTASGQVSLQGCDAQATALYTCLGVP